MNTIIVKVNDATQTVNQVQVVTQDGRPTVITAQDKVNYEFLDTAIGHAPNHIVAKRINNDLHVSFEKEGKESDLVIEGFYNYSDNALLGIAEDGEYYYYVPDTGEAYDYVTQLAMGDVEGHALGGQNYAAAAVAFPWWIPAIAGLGLLGLIAGGGGGGDNNTPTPVNNAPIAKDDTLIGVTGEPVIIDVLANDTDLQSNIDPSTVQLVDPTLTSADLVSSVTVAGEGTWSVNPDTGIITFTPVSGFVNDPTPIKYVVADDTGLQSNQATITIDYPSLVSITGTTSISETPATGTVNTATYTVSLSNPSSIDTVVTVVISDVSTEGAADYTAPVTQQVTILAGATTANFSVPIVDDNIFEGPESFTATVTNVVGNATIDTTKNKVTTTIYDDGTTDGDPTNPVDPTNPDLGDDTPVATVTSPAAVAEGNLIDFNVALSNPATTDTLVNLTLVGVTADLGVDTGTPVLVSTDGGNTFTPAILAANGSFNVTVPANSTNGIIVRVPTTDDNIDEPNETLTLTATTPTQDTPSTGTGTIIDNDDTPVVSITGTASLSETAADGNANTATYTVSLSNPSTVNTTVTVVISDGSTEGAADYTAPVTQQVTIPAGATTANFSVPIVDDNIFEGPESFTVSVQNVVTGTATVGTNNSVTTTIYDNGTTDGSIPVNPSNPDLGDDTPSVTVTDNNALEGSNLVHTVTLDVVAQAPVTYDFSISNGTATAGSDYTNTPSFNNGVTYNPTAGTITVPSGVKSFTISYPTLVDGVVEGGGNETVNLTVGNDSAIGSIIDANAPLANPNSQTGGVGNAIVMDVLGNDSDFENNIDPTSVKLINPISGVQVLSVIVANEGVWSVNVVNGSVTFTPNAGFTDNPTPINYVVSDLTGLQSDQATITPRYQTPTVAFDDLSTPGMGVPVIIDVLENDFDRNANTEATSVKLIDPSSGAQVTSVTVADEGSWSVNTVNGLVTFTPNAGLTTDPTPIKYVVSDTTGLESNQATITIDYVPLAGSSSGRMAFDASVNDDAVIDMTDGVAETLVLSLQDVIDTAGSSGNLFIDGDSATDTGGAADAVDLTVAFTKAATSNEVGYDLYQSNNDDTQLYINTDVTVI